MSCLGSGLRALSYRSIRIPQPHRSPLAARLWTRSSLWHASSPLQPQGPGLSKQPDLQHHAQDLEPTSAPTGPELQAPPSKLAIPEPASSASDSQPPTKSLDAVVRTARARVDQALEALKNDTLPKLTRHINSLTGYAEVEQRKKLVLEKEQIVGQRRQEMEETKRVYESTVDEHERCQQEIISLQQRKDSWQDDDITRVTFLYRKDKSLEQAEAAAKEAHHLATEAFERAQIDYLGEIRERYVEEQLYSDKIRQTSNWWTMGLISLHITLFVLVQLVVEPRKRRRFQDDLLVLIENKAERDRQALETQVLEHLRLMSATSPVDIGSTNTVDLPPTTVTEAENPVNQIQEIGAREPAALLDRIQTFTEAGPTQHAWLQGLAVGILCTSAVFGIVS
ncbi:Mdm33 family-domain-containing protein, partial [Polychytrium aggregatum]|uniref:Mdm33 family-domain-containing protein n=1 Tax=Polychytrium aggregatum TaxID=110093 RepID=UPI0022FE4E25